MDRGDLVEWDVTFGRTFLGTKRGTIIARDGCHLVLKLEGPRPASARLQSPFRACQTHEVRLVRRAPYLMRLSMGLMCWLAMRWRSLSTSSSGGSIKKGSHIS